MKQTLGRFLLQPNKDFPADCELFDYMQTNAHVVSIIGNLAGDKAVLLGCELTDNDTRRAEGYVFLRTREHPEGEVLFWEGGVTGGGMYLRQEPVAVQAQGYDYPQAYVRRSLAPGVGEENYRWDDFHEAQTLPGLRAELAELRAALAAARPAPLGSVDLWAGHGVPEGYLLCEGQQLRQTEYPELYAAIGSAFNTACDWNGQRLVTTEGFFRLPDLRGRFIVGQNPFDNDYQDLGAVGGRKTHILTVDEMPSHVHPLDDYYYPESRDNGGISGVYPIGRRVFGSGRTDGDNAYLFYITHDTKSTGRSRAHENRPPYYALAYIMRVR